MEMLGHRKIRVIRIKMGTKKMIFHNLEKLLQKNSALFGVVQKKISASWAKSLARFKIIW